MKRIISLIALTLSLLSNGIANAHIVAQWNHRFYYINGNPPALTSRDQPNWLGMLNLSGNYVEQSNDVVFKDIPDSEYNSAFRTGFVNLFGDVVKTKITMTNVDMTYEVSNNGTTNYSHHVVSLNNRMPTTYESGGFEIGYPVTNRIAMHAWTLINGVNYNYTNNYLHATHEYSKEYDLNTKSVEYVKTNTFICHFTNNVPYLDYIQVTPTNSIIFTNYYEVACTYELQKNFTCVTQLNETVTNLLCVNTTQYVDINNDVEFARRISWSKGRFMASEDRATFLSILEAKKDSSSEWRRIYDYYTSED